MHPFSSPSSKKSRWGKRSCATPRTAPAKQLSAANCLEVAIVVDANRNPVLSRRLDDMIVIEPVTREQAAMARPPYRDFGKGSGHPAGLDFCNCFACTLAKATRKPLRSTAAILKVGNF